MAIKKDITWKTLSVTGAVLRIRDVEAVNSPNLKRVVINYAIYASAAAYSAGAEPIDSGAFELNNSASPTEWGQFVTKMREVGEDVISASYVAVKQLAQWTGATNEDLGDEI